MKADLTMGAVFLMIFGAAAAYYLIHRKDRR